MKRHHKTAIIAIILMVMLSMLGCSVGRRIVKGADTPTPTPTSTRRPTFTVTISPTPSPLVTDTPTSTPTPEVPPTDTPVPATNTPETPPTNTPEPTSPPQPKPTSPPPPPTDTPVPPTPEPTRPSTPFIGTIITGLPNCGSTGVFGFIKDTAGNNAQDYYIHAWTDNWEGVWTKTKGESFGNDNDRNFDLPISEGSVVAGSWHVAVTEGRNLNLLSPIYELTTSQHCEGDGAVQWTRMDFKKVY